MTFDTLGLSPKVLDAITTAGFTEPTPIQAQGIPPALEGRDVLGLAQTGSGKTAAFALPMLCKLERGRARARMPRSLIIEPTRELAAQVHEAFETLGAKHKLNVALLIGGVSFDEQDRKLSRGADVLIATPGRLLDHFERGKLLLTGVEIFVVDEADRMLDMGFIPDLERIYKLLPFTRQTLFFSATMPPEIERLTNTFLHSPVEVEVAKRSATAESITQNVMLAPRDFDQKRDALRDVLRKQSDDVNNAIIFANRKTTVGILEKSLQSHGFNAAALHGDMDQHARLRTLNSFRDGKITYLIASDVAARGLDIPDVSHVYNFDIPTHAEDYVHRIGRTGRAGRKGNSITLVQPDEFRYLKDVEKLIEKKIDWLGDEPTEEEIAEASAKRGRGRGRGGDKSRGRKPSSGKRTEKSADSKRSEKAAAPASEKRDAPKKSRGDRKSRRPADQVEAMPDVGKITDSGHIPAFLQR
ncbi:MAG: DEAD/DEAH box helicase [Alphaproteobacteria bacterium]|nr:DEAD/DEAH box helicase [Alphaproteobacteria bacterium]